MAQDRIHHPALTVEGVDELELAEKDRRLAGQDRGEPPRLGGAHSHSRHQQAGEAAFDLDRDGERVLRRADQVEQGAKPASSGGRVQRAQQLSAVGDRNPGRNVAVVGPADQLAVFEQPELALRTGKRTAHEPGHLGAGAVGLSRRQLRKRGDRFQRAYAAAGLSDQSRVLDRDRRVPCKVEGGGAGFRNQGGPMDGADRADQAVAVPKRDQVPCVLAGSAAYDAGWSDTVVGAQPGPAEHLIGCRLPARAGRGDAAVGVESPTRGAGGLEHRAGLVGNVGNHAHQLVAGQGGELLDAHRLRQRELVRVMEAHGAQRDSHHRHRRLQQLHVSGQEARPVGAHGDDTGDDAVVLRDRRPHDVARRAREDVAADRSIEVCLLVGHGVLHVGPSLDQPPEERSVLDRDRPDRGRRLGGRACESRHLSRDVDVGEHHVRRLEVLAGDREHGLRELALVRRPGDAQLEEVQGLEPRPLGLRLGEVVGIGQRKAHVGRNVLEKLHVPVVERVLGVGLQRQHGRDAVAAQDRHPYKRARYAPPVRRRT